MNVDYAPILDIRKLCKDNFHDRMNNTIFVPYVHHSQRISQRIIIYLSCCLFLFGCLYVYNDEINRYYCNNFPQIVRFDEYLEDSFPTLFATRNYFGNAHICQKYSFYKSSQLNILHA